MQNKCAILTQLNASLIEHMPVKRGQILHQTKDGTSSNFCFVVTSRSLISRSSEQLAQLFDARLGTFSHAATVPRVITLIAATYKLLDVHHITVLDEVTNLLKSLDSPIGAALNDAVNDLDDVLVDRRLSLKLVL